MVLDPSLLFHFVVLGFEDEIPELIVRHNERILPLCVLNAVGVIVVLGRRLHNKTFGS